MVAARGRILAGSPTKLFACATGGLYARAIGAAVFRRRCVEIFAIHAPVTTAGIRSLEYAVDRGRCHATAFVLIAIGTCELTHAART